MPDNDFSERALAHVAIDLFRDPGQYRFPNRPQNREPKRDDYHAHAETLLQQLNAALGATPAPNADDRLPIAGLKAGTIVEVETLAPDGDRVKASKIPAIEFPGQDIVVLRSQRNADRTESAVLFVPDDARGFLREKIERYGDDNLGNRARPDVDRFETVETIRAAVMQTLFQGPVDFNDEAVSWWELWVRQPALRADSVAGAAQNAGLDVHPERLIFPDTVVLFVHASVAALVDLARRMPGAVSEIRRATGTIEPFLEQGDHGLGQADFVAELADRVTAPPEGAPSVCVIDTGIAAGHPLIAPALAGTWTYDDRWGTDDHEPHGGHGTAMASLVLYGDLEPAMNDQRAVALGHTVESVKFLPPRGFPATDPSNYGVVTQGAVARVEIDRPDTVRSFCVATSSPDFSPARPSSWSGAIDQLCAGAMPGERVDNVSAARHPKRLLLIATGNAEPGQRDVVEMLKSLEDPAQSWNALTVGGYTAKEAIPADPPGLAALVPANNRSPYSRGSCDLPDDLTPIKPEVLFEAGNMLVDAGGYCGSHPAVSLLAAGSDVAAEPLIPFNATSAATGVAGNFLGRLKAALPGYWPETYRALTVNAAEWPQPIRSKLIGTGAHWKSISKGRRQAILREVGYGVPDLDRAILSAANDVTMVAQAEIQPYASVNGQPPVFNEMHFYDLPWPRALLQELENAIVVMKVTLSYFVEPNLSGRAATRPDTYRSYGLRFEMKKRTETGAAFKRRMTAQRAADDVAAKEASHWLLGPNAVQAGSLHCDLWRGAAVDLASHDAIAVYPVGGWWKSHVGQRRMNDIARYALVLSLSAPGQDVDLHADISALVEAKAIEVAAAQIEAAPGAA
ncbi:S8 family peptidase [Sphingomonas sp. TX0522]|uniref:S8 family peptidase n=1 Tax=Sphingomonas sp. TX0522 TaxID=2479205 RepID=UPI0018E03FE4|nr:S8 family peptidase [Sphingomonas sp. TX0522]MBI0530314.1 peptidase [Sphingomonas sp. TX0522]